MAKKEPRWFTTNSYIHWRKWWSETDQKLHENEINFQFKIQCNNWSSLKRIVFQDRWNQTFSIFRWMITGCRSDFRTATSLNFKLRYLYLESLSKKWLLERHLLQILKLLNWWIWRILEHVILRSLKCS